MFWRSTHRICGEPARLTNWVEQAHQDLIADEVFSAHRRVIFLCHSMGGLVTRKMLTRYQPLAESVPLIYFCYADGRSGDHAACQRV